jgi:phosphoribosylformylglycinamidine synthase
MQEKLVQDVCLALIRNGWIRSAHDISDGGLAVALAECCIGDEKRWLGAEVVLPGKGRMDVALFGESAARILVSVPPGQLSAVMKFARMKGCPAKKIGVVGGRQLIIRDVLELEVSKLAEEWWTSFEKCVSA